MKFIRPLSQTTLISDANLVSYWPLDGNANDYKNVNNGTSTAVAYGGQYAQFGQGGYFNGGSSNIVVADSNSLDILSTISISFWIYLPSANTTYATIFYKGTESGTNNVNYCIDLGSDGRTIRFVYWTTTFRYYTSTTQLPLGSWVHVACTNTFGTSTGYQLYINGIAVSSTPSATFIGESVAANTYQLSVGYRGYSNDRFINGYVDDVAIFNRALTATEVAYLAAGETFINNRPLADTRFFTDANLMAYWKFDGNSNDSKGSYNGTDTAITYGTQYGIFGQGALFNGTSSKIVLPSIATNVNTFSCWFKKLDNATAYLYVQDNTDAPEARILFVSNTITLNYYSYGAYQAQISYPFTDTTSWHHIVGVWNTNNVRLYLDGVLVGSDTSATMQSATAVNHSIGWYTRSSTYYFNGYIDDAAVFSRALSTTEVQELYEKEVVRAIYRPLEQTRFRNDDNLVAYWKLDGNSNDSKGTNNGTDTAVTYGTQYGIFGQGASFNGSNSSINIPTTGLITGPTSYTISAWVCPAALPADGAISMILWYGANAGYQATGLGLNNSGGTQYVNFGVYYNDIKLAKTLTLNQWYHLVGTYDGTTATLYLDGVFQSSGARSINITQGDFHHIGSWAGGSFIFNGKLDDISIFNRALSREEVAELYRSQTVGEIQPLSYKPQGGLYATSLINDANLVSYWKMDGNSRDSKGTNHGTDTSMIYASSYGKFGQGAYFNGSNSNINLGDPASLRFGTGGFSISFWIKFNSYDASEALFNKDPDGSKFFIALYSGQIAANNLLTSGNLAYSPVLTVGLWYHIAITRSAGGVTVGYLNGIQYSTVSGTNRDISAIGTNWIITGANAWYINGSMDDVAMFNRDLSSSEVFEIYSKGESSPFRPLDAVPDLRQDSSLVSYWKLNGDALDSKGTNNGTATNVTYSVGVNGRFGQASIFNGTTSIITTAQINMTRYTWAMWIKPNGVQTDSAALISEQYSGNYVQYAQYFNESTLNLVVGSYDGTWHTTPAYTIADGVWQHIAHTYDGSYHRLYVNGVNVSSLAWTGTPSAQGLQTRIGRRWDNPNYFKGMMDDISAFNRALTNAEIYQLYTQGSTVGYWKLNGSSTDYSGNGNHGTDTAITYAQGNGVFNQGALFNGSSSYIDCNAQLLSNNSPFSYSVWINFSVSQTSKVIIGRHNNATGGSALGIDDSLADKIKLHLNNYSTQRVNSTIALNDAKWHHIVGTWDGTTLRLYVDGVLDASATPATTLTYPALNHNIGRWVGGGTQYFNGSIDEVIIENRPWSASEVRKYYTKSKRMFI